MSGVSASVPRLQAGAAGLKAIEQPGRRSQRQRLLCRLSLAGADILVVQSALMLAVLGLPLLNRAGIEEVAWSAALAAVSALGILIPSMVAGLYDPAGFNPLERFRTRVYGAFILLSISFALLAVVQPVRFNHVALLAITAVLSLPLAILAETVVCQTLIARSIWGESVIVVGSGSLGAQLAAQLLANPQAGLRPVGYCGDPVPVGSDGVPWLGALSELEGLGGVADIAVIALSAETCSQDLVRLPFRRVVVVPELYLMPANWVRTRTLGNSAVLDFTNPANQQNWAKRLLDCVIAIPLLILTMPLVLGVALAIRVISPGPVFYIQRRVGWRGRQVSILKLRSMYVDADRRLEAFLSENPEAQREWETYVKLSRDPRVLPGIGQFIRRTSIDELPQLWNVVRGDLSLVGPRPFPAYHIEKFPVPFQALRCSVRPGLTGLWQVTDRSGADLRQQEAIDTFYIRNWSIWLDLHIVLRTVPAVLRARGAL